MSVYHDQYKYKYQITAKCATKVFYTRDKYISLSHSIPLLNLQCTKDDKYTDNNLLVNNDQTYTPTSKKNLTQILSFERPRIPDISIQHKKLIWYTAIFYNIT